MTVAIEVVDVTKRYSDFLAVDHVSFEGRIFWVAGSKWCG